MWTLWKFVLRRLAKAQGFLDPMMVVSNLQHFSKPSEVWVPVELLRSGAVLQARGLINSQAIQNNLDWIWPFWVERQFYPTNVAFIPRAFSLTHINLTERNWTALGLPDLAEFPLVDPRGLVTPLFDGWSLDAWVMDEGENLIPCRLNHVKQELDLDNTFAVLTKSKSVNFVLESRAEVNVADITEGPACIITYDISAKRKAWLMLCVRPYNPEGVSFIRDLKVRESEDGWIVNKKENIYLDRKPDRYVFANYNSGDLGEQVYWADRGEKNSSISCVIGMATSAALYELAAGQQMQITVKVPLSQSHKSVYTSWHEHLPESCKIEIPDKHFQFLFETALRTMVLHSPGDIYPGPFTYKRFWFRDAAFILHTMASVGLFKNIEKIIDRFPARQTPTGYFMSQDGEWDSNGQAIWAMKKFVDITNQHMKEQWVESIYKAAKWIIRKRHFSDKDPLHNGLLPAGFSAEHFGPNDFYYWDDFWAVTGLRQAASLARFQNLDIADDFAHQADDLLKAVEKSISLAPSRLRHPGIPASASRRMDAGAIGVLAASYPLQIYLPDDERILQTCQFLMDKYFLQGAFYHEISHSGINIYLSLHIAQVLLRASDQRFFEIVKSVAALATQTGQWPEAIHPATKGGCMGDGQHIWAAAEWVMMLCNMFVRQEETEGKLILCSGIPPEWLKPNERLSLGPVYTVYGRISLMVKVIETEIEISWQADWHGAAPQIEIHLPGHGVYAVNGHETSRKIKMSEAVV